MRNILIISRREVLRLRSRFTGRSRLFVFGIVGVAVLLSFVIYHQGPVISKALYDVGVDPQAPQIGDARFNAVAVDNNSAYSELRDRDIDVYIAVNRVEHRDDDRSQYTLGALKQYFEKDQLLQLYDDYEEELEKAFPLRIGVHHLDKDADSSEAPPLPASASSEPDEPPNPGVATAQASTPPPPPNPTPKPASPAQSGETNGVPPNGLDSGHSPSQTDDAVRNQLREFRDEGALPEFKAEFASDDEVIVPSLMTPPVPFAQVLLAFFYIVPSFLLSVFFTSSFMEEKTNRKLVILMSAPVTPLQVILGKMLPYIGYSMAAIIGITLILGGNVGLALAIFMPVVLFVLSIYLMVALLYRTFKDQTFFSLMAVWIVTAYLVAPAMFTGVNDLAYISPLTLAVLMYRHESFGLMEYFLSTIPMYAVFGVTMFVAVRIMNEEYLMGFRPLYRKLSEAIELLINPRYVSLSIMGLSFILIPIAFMAQFASIVLAYNLSTNAGLGVVFVLAVITEELVKSVGIVVLLQNRKIRRSQSVAKLSFMSAVGFLTGEKLLLYLALGVMSRTLFIDAVFSAGFLVLPLVMHFVSTCLVCLVTRRLGVRYYAVGILAGSAVHGIYNFLVIHVLGGGGL